MKIARDVENALERLPETLSELYSLILEQIQQMEPEARKIAINVLQWLLCAQTTLSVQQLLDLVSLPSREASYKALTTDDLLNVCCNLVVLDQQLDCFRLHTSQFTISWMTEMDSNMTCCTSWRQTAAWIFTGLGRLRIK